MADYSAEGNRTASTTLGVLEVDADATRPRRLQLMEWIFGSEATAADNPFLWKLQRVTGAGSIAFTTVTLIPLDPADAATEADAGEALTVNPGVGNTLLSIPLNQRATNRWVAQPGVDILAPATASNGFIIQTPTSSAVAVTTTVIVREY